jgi:hypothetical protein
MFKCDPKAPQSLLKFEQWITKIVRVPLRHLDERQLPIYDLKTKAEIEKAIQPSAHLNAAQSIGLYHQQYWFRLFLLAQENFPTLLRLFGYSDFNQLIAEPAFLKYPPNQWRLSATASQIPLWIEADYLEEDKIFILQIAQLDAIYHDLLYASQKENKRSIRLNGDLVHFRHQLLEHEPEYWLETDFPEIDFSKEYFFSFSQELDQIRCNQ